MEAMGFSINMLTLFGLVLAVGIVVDDAIVVVENVERKLKEGLTPEQAARVTMDEVGTALVAIPISLIGTFAVMLVLGYSLNTLTLFGLVLAVGIVVDDAIVVVENVERKLREGLSPLEAARVTMNEVGTAVLAIAIVLVAVFVPAAFIGGITGQFFRQFAVTIASATIISAFVSLTLSPALCAILFKAHGEGDVHHGKAALVMRPLTIFFNAFNRTFDHLANGYSGMVRSNARIGGGDGSPSRFKSATARPVACGEPLATSTWFW
jgi:multidrug efflux pump subunit AcrB